ncbi:MAG: hypothetical protein AAF368_04480 [Planctomycetota bacterium]
MEHAESRFPVDEVSTYALVHERDIDLALVGATLTCPIPWSTEGCRSSGR